MKKLLILLGLLILVLFVGEQKKLFPGLDINKYIPKITPPASIMSGSQTVVYEESVITKVVEESIPSVVTIGISKTTRSNDLFDIDPFNPFSPFRRIPGKEKQIEQNIGSGFIIAEDGLIVTNKHVVDDTEASYKVLTNDQKTYEVKEIYRDQPNDIAIIKIDAKGLKPLKLGDSSKLKLGQITIAIGTPLGEFPNTVTSGIVSGLGRGITAGSPFEGYVEKLDDVIQTDAAISPGNSGGPLLNSAGEVIGVNTAIASEGQNIGFAIPVNILKSRIDRFKAKGGSFKTPFIGVRYEMIERKRALLNDVVPGAYIIEVVENSPADKAEIQEEDIITEIDGKKLSGEDQEELSKIIFDKKIGDNVKLKIWRPKFSEESDGRIEGDIISKTVKLEASE